MYDLPVDAAANKEETVEEVKEEDPYESPVWSDSEIQSFGLGGDQAAPTASGIS